MNYAWESAEMLGADHTQIAFSARALTTGYGCADDKTGLDTQYFQLKNFNHLDDKPQTPVGLFVYAADHRHQPGPERPVRRRAGGRR